MMRRDTSAEDGATEDEAIIGGAMERVRPVPRTALVASLGFVPMALATGTGGPRSSGHWRPSSLAG